MVNHRPVYCKAKTLLVGIKGSLLYKHAHRALLLLLCSSNPTPLLSPLFPFPSPPTHPPSKKPPPNKNKHDQPHRPERPILLQQQLPIDPHRRLPILPTVLPEPLAHIAHALQTVAAVEEVFDVLRHDFRDDLELGVELVEVLGGARVLVGFFGALDEGVEFDEGVGAEGGGEVLGGVVGLRGVERVLVGGSKWVEAGKMGEGGGKSPETYGGELVGKIGEVGEGELSRVGFITDGEEADGGGDEVAR